MRFYTKRDQFYYSIDLNARTMYVCIMDDDTLYHRPVARAYRLLHAQKEVAFRCKTVLFLESIS